MSLLSYAKKVYANLTTPALNATNLNAVETFLQQGHAEMTARATNDVGIITYFAFATTPSNWLKCDGTAVSRTTYASLFAVIGTTFGTGDGSTTFNLPDLRGVFIRGYDDGAGRDSGRTFGSYQADDLPTHNHQFTDDQLGGNSQTDEDATGAWFGTGTTTRTSTTNADVASESAPKNITFVACIKYA